jgi:hypothetical protein
MDSPDGRLMQPPPRYGRFIAHSSEAGYTPVPVGAFEEGDAFCLRFGEPFHLPKSTASDPQEWDREIAVIVMDKIAALTPNPSPSPPSAD